MAVADNGLGSELDLLREAVMGGGQLIVYGVLLLLAALIGVTRWACWVPLCFLVKGALPPLIMVAGLFLLVLGISDWRGAAAEAKPSADQG